MSPRIQPSARAFELDAFKLDHAMWFKLSVPGSEGSPSPEEIGIPIAIVHRLHYLGRAYDGQIVKYLAGSGSVAIGFHDMQRLSSELSVVEEATADPVAKHYLAILLSLLRRSVAYPSSSLICVERKNAAQQPIAASRER
jgi:hypothetical protein